jgi:hypothetical protein
MGGTYIRNEKTDAEWKTEDWSTTTGVKMK